MRRVSDLLHVVHDLAKKTHECPDLPQVVATPARTRPAFAGNFVLTCPDYLRKFEATITPGKEAAAGTAVCTHCDAHVPFLIEISEPE
jgi:hypothetical protein